MIHRAALRSHHNINITFMGRAQREDDDVLKLCQLSASQMEKYTRNQTHLHCYSTGFYFALFFIELKRHEEHDNTSTNTTVAPLIKTHSNMTSARYHPAKQTLLKDKNSE